MERTELPSPSPSINENSLEPDVKTCVITSLNSDVTIQLSNEDLWKRFHSVTTEMVLTKNGRKIFPKLEYLINGLDESCYYMLTMQIARVDDNRYKFNNASWVPAGRGEPYFPAKEIMHSDGAMLGKHWMRGPVNFDSVKITNNAHDTNSKHIYLLSMHKFVPVLTIYKCSKPPNAHSLNPIVAAVSSETETIGIGRFPCTEFIAVTAYQNQSITALKIKYNPFAKGFRDGGTSKRSTSPCDSASPPPIKRASFPQSPLVPIPTNAFMLPTLLNLNTHFPTLPALPAMPIPFPNAMYSPLMLFNNALAQYLCQHQILMEQV